MRNSLVPYKYNRNDTDKISDNANKPLADLLPDIFCLMVRIFRLMLVLLYIYINSNNIPPIMIINRIYETHNLLVGLRTYQHPYVCSDCTYV